MKNVYRLPGLRAYSKAQTSSDAQNLAVSPYGVGISTIKGLHTANIKNTKHVNKTRSTDHVEITQSLFHRLTLPALWTKTMLFLLTRLVTVLLSPSCPALQTVVIGICKIENERNIVVSSTSPNATHPLFLLDLHSTNCHVALSICKTLCIQLETYICSM